MATAIDTNPSQQRLAFRIFSGALMSATYTHVHEKAAVLGDYSAAQEEQSEGHGRLRRR